MQDKGTENTAAKSQRKDAQRRSQSMSPKPARQTDSKRIEEKGGDHGETLQENVVVDGLQAQIDIAMDQMVRAFRESAEIKQGIMEYVHRCREMYSDQIQKFSVLAYDYLERIENHSKRD